MPRFKTYFTIFCLLTTAKVMAQDPVFSQFYASKAYLNPALVAYEQGLTLSTSYRNQWRGLSDQLDYQTLLVSAEWRKEKWGFGCVAYQDTEGVGRLMTTEINLMSSYRVQFKNDGEFLIGLQCSPFLRREMNTRGLIFSDQLDPILGVVTPTIQHPMDNLRTGAFDIATGFAYSKTLTKIYNKKDLRLLAGLSVHRLLQPCESILQTSERTPMRFTAHVGLEIPLIQFSRTNKQEWLYWMPTIRFDSQKTMDLLNLGCFFIYKNNLFVGVFYQNSIGENIGKNTDAVVFQLGFQWALSTDRTAQISIGYDANNNGLGFSGASGGVYEIHTKFNFGDAQFSKSRKSSRMPSNPKCVF